VTLSRETGWILTSCAFIIYYWLLEDKRSSLQINESAFFNWKLVLTASSGKGYTLWLLEEIILQNLATLFWNNVSGIKGYS
jgi:hypothetical protein